MKKSSIFLFAGAIALGLVGCGGSGNSAAPVTTRDAAVVGVVGIDAWYPTVSSIVYLLNGVGTFPPARSGSSSVNFQNWSSPFSPSQRGPGLLRDGYTGYFVDFDLQDPNTVLMKFHESDSVDSAVKGTGTIGREINGLDVKYSIGVEIPGGRRPLRSLLELSAQNGSSFANYTTEYILGTGAKRRVVEGSGLYGGSSIGGDMVMTHNGRVINFQNIGINGSQFTGTYAIDGITGQLQGATSDVNVRIGPVGSQPGMTGEIDVLSGEFTMTPDGGSVGPIEDVFDY